MYKFRGGGSMQKVCGGGGGGTGEGMAVHRGAKHCTACWSRRKSLNLDSTQNQDW